MSIRAEIQEIGENGSPSFPCLAKHADGTLALFVGVKTGMILSGSKFGCASDQFIPVTDARWNVFPPGTRVTLIVE